MCLLTWPLNESEAGVDLVLMETSLLFLCKLLLISLTTASLTKEKYQGGFFQNRVNYSLTFVAVAEVRICVDMRKSNEAMLRDKREFPTVEDILQELNGALKFLQT